MRPYEIIDGCVGLLFLIAVWSTAFIVVRAAKRRALEKADRVIKRFLDDAEKAKEK